MSPLLIVNVNLHSEILLGFVEKRIAVATSPNGQVVGEANQVARRNLTTGYPG